MIWPFYLMALVAIVSTIRVVTNANPVHALLSLIVSLLAVSGMFMIVGAPFAGALEIIVYAGAIMVLFLFVIMMLQEPALASERRRRGPWAWAAVLLPVAALAAGGAAWAARRGAAGGGGDASGRVGHVRLRGGGVARVSGVWTAEFRGEHIFIGRGS